MGKTAYKGKIFSAAQAVPHARSTAELALRLNGPLVLDSLIDRNSPTLGRRSSLAITPRLVTTRKPSARDTHTQPGIPGRLLPTCLVREPGRVSIISIFQARKRLEAIFLQQRCRQRRAVGGGGSLQLRFQTSLLQQTTTLPFVAGRVPVDMDFSRRSQVCWNHDSGSEFKSCEWHAKSRLTPAERLRTRTKGSEAGLRQAVAGCDDLTSDT
ncbi:hypothetical protein QBC34DRAFT_408790 [Podospora aff. communis PSN243]|uniref:Uncharacterized protein n=1 Tax=Podospora aff. communis PSN243 TaxID=3040156 RepID=A0AAV9GK73_9PEZI|nr:hypothetical protein QBC34DRAFT_408790 [Podospora aff. communis PSN243]